MSAVPRGALILAMAAVSRIRKPRDVGSLGFAFPSEPCVGDGRRALVGLAGVPAKAAGYRSTWAGRPCHGLGAGALPRALRGGGFAGGLGFLGFHLDFLDLGVFEDLVQRLLLAHLD